MKKFFSIWENQSKNGNIYYTGKLGELDLIGFKNTQKKNPKEPDITFYVKEDKPKKDETKVYTKDVETNDIFQDFGEQISIEDNMLD